MIKVLYNAIGTLVATILENTTVLSVDSTLQATLLSAIGTGDWTYLAIDNGDSVEVVKIYRVDSSGLRVIRAQDNTLARKFAAGTPIAYRLTAAEIRDSIIAPPLILLPYGGIDINGREVSYFQITIEGLGGAFATASENDVRLGRNEQAYGCCSLDNPGIPPIGPPYEYLTSQLYPIEAEDGYECVTALLAGLVQGVNRDAYETDTALTGGALITLVHVYDMPRTDAYETDTELTGGALIRLVVTTDIPREAYETDTVLTGGSLV